MLPLRDDIFCAPSSASQSRAAVSRQRAIPRIHHSEKAALQGRAEGEAGIAPPRLPLASATLPHQYAARAPVMGTTTASNMRSTWRAHRQVGSETRSLRYFIQIKCYSNAVN